jgi:hypothetical protein
VATSCIAVCPDAASGGNVSRAGACPPLGCFDPPPSGKVEIQSCPLPTEPVPTTTVPAEPADLPSEHEARQIALDLLEATGADVSGAHVATEDVGGIWSVTVEPVVDGVPAPGLDMYVTVGAKRRIDGASGHLGKVEKLGDYPLIDTKAAITRLNQGWGFGGVVPDVAASSAAESARPATAGSDTAVSSDPGVTDNKPGPGTGPPTVNGSGSGPDGSTLPTPVPMPPEPTVPLPKVAVTDAEMVLVMVPSWDESGSYLVPGYRFTADDRSSPTVPAVDDEVLKPPPDVPETTVPSKGEPEPGQVDPSGPTSTTPTEPTGTAVSVKLSHCGFEDLRLDGKRWVVEDPPFDATNAPPEFVGKGHLAVPDGGGKAVYTDEAGFAVTFVAVDESWQPPPCD